VKIQKIDFNEPNFPDMLKNIPDPPRQLYYLSDTLPALLDKPRLAVVGSRAVTPYGKAAIAKLVRDVAQKGVVIISGLALGVDGEAHRAALDAHGLTIAVLPSGLDEICPRTHRELAMRILQQGGALVSEYPEGTPPYKPSFVARNRLIAGLSQAVLIPEAAVKSGSLHTAEFALEQGRDVLAIPGNITSATSAGTNNLIKTGATPITNAKDILDAMGLVVDTKQSRMPLADNPEEQVILELLHSGTTDAADLLLQSDLDAATFNQTLTMLEISGRIKSISANNWLIN
jgi:DNA processing protein